MATTIDATWITNAGNAPYVLGTDNEVYTLAVDVNVTTPGFSGPVFKLTGKNVQLNLNGRLVQVNGVDHPQITDSAMYRKTSIGMKRSDSTKNVRHYGGQIFDGNAMQDILPPSLRPSPLPFADAQ